MPADNGSQNQPDTTYGDTGSQSSGETGGPIEVLPYPTDGPYIGVLDGSLVPTIIGPTGDFSTTPEPLPIFQSLIDQPAPDSTAYFDSLTQPTWDTDFHTLQMPVATTSTGVCSFAVVAQPTQKKRVQWTAVSVGDWPNMPDFDTGDSNDVLLNVTIQAKNVELLGDQNTPIYSVTGEYMYGLRNYQNTKMYVGVPPYVDINLTETIIPDSSFVSGIASP